MADLTCPTCGPTTTEPHPRLPGVVRCVNCREHLSTTPDAVYRAAAEAALRRHVGDDRVDGLSAEYLDELITDWWDTPDSRARVDAAYAAGREARDAGPCMDSSPRFEGCTPLLCELRAGHAGGHQSGTASWTKADDVERAKSERDAYEAGFEAGREAAAQAIEPTFTRAQIDRAVHFAECRNGKPRDWRYFTDLGDDEECDCGYYPAAEIARGEHRG